MTSEERKNFIWSVIAHRQSMDDPGKSAEERRKAKEALENSNSLVNRRSQSPRSYSYEGAEVQSTVGSRVGSANENSPYKSPQIPDLPGTSRKRSQSSDSSRSPRGLRSIHREITPTSRSIRERRRGGLTDRSAAPLVSQDARVSLQPSFKSRKAPSHTRHPQQSRYHVDKNQRWPHFQNARSPRQTSANPHSVSAHDQNGQVSDAAAVSSLNLCADAQVEDIRKLFSNLSLGCKKAHEKTPDQHKTTQIKHRWGAPELRTSLHSTNIRRVELKNLLSTHRLRDIANMIYHGALEKIIYEEGTRKAFAVFLESSSCQCYHDSVVAGLEYENNWRIKVDIVEEPEPLSSQGEEMKKKRMTRCIKASNIPDIEEYRPIKMNDTGKQFGGLDRCFSRGARRSAPTSGLTSGHQWDCYWHFESIEKAAQFQCHLEQKEFMNASLLGITIEFMKDPCGVYQTFHTALDENTHEEEIW